MRKKSQTRPACRCLQLVARAPGPQERLLSQVFGGMGIPGQPQGKPVDGGSVLFEKFSHGNAASVAHALFQEAADHRKLRP